MTHTWTSETATVTEDVTTAGHVTEPRPVDVPDHHADDSDCGACDTLYHDGYDDGRMATKAYRPADDRHSRWMDRLLILAVYLGLALVAWAVLR